MKRAQRIACAVAAPVVLLDLAVAILWRACREHRYDEQTAELDWGWPS